MGMRGFPMNLLLRAPLVAALFLSGAHFALAADSHKADEKAAAPKAEAKHDAKVEAKHESKAEAKAVKPEEKAERVVVFDGAFGTFVQGLALTADDFGVATCVASSRSCRLVLSVSRRARLHTTGRASLLSSATKCGSCRRSMSAPS